MKSLYHIFLFFVIIAQASCSKENITLPNLKVSPPDTTKIITPPIPPQNFEVDSVCRPETPQPQPTPVVEAKPEVFIQEKSNPKPELKIIKEYNNNIYKKDYHEGKVVYKIPSVMQVRETYQVLVRVSQGSLNIYENLNGEVKETTIPVTPTMQVKLIDPSPTDNPSFSIVSDNEAIQSVDTNETYTQWTWDVTPLRSGHSELKIVVSTITNGDKKDDVYEDKVEIKVNPIKQIGFFLKTYWQWVIATLLIPMIKWLYDRYTKKKDYK